ncbi:peptide chain release factor N(5)-glutamine methyltransferase [Thermodesulfitimonas autotrophica]|uniref:peptide chain release factor N(5)-glutamine methyltransferase n=1 Tax=Thermodesulfitimonas autotrophica TaxID=1894989 RepID=UPI002FE17107
MQADELLRAATGELKAAGCASPRLDAEVLLSAVLGCDRLALYREPARQVTDQEAAAFRALLSRRAGGEPVAYLTGEKEFMGLRFKVTPAVLIPRPETELLVETALALLRGVAAPLVADVGTGCGAIAVSLAVSLPAARIFATDVSPAALAVARENAVRQGVAGRIAFFVGDLLEPLLPAGEPVLDLVAANLPYIPTGAMHSLPREVRREPAVALDGGADGLTLYGRLVPQAGRLLKPGGYLLMEIGPGQGENALLLVPPPMWEARVEPDLAGRERLVIACRSR